MLEDFMDMKGVNDVDNEKFSQEITDMVGTYTSPDGADVKTISLRVDKDLFIRYDILCRLFKRTKRQDFEYFMRWSIERYKSESKGLDTFFQTKDEDIKENE